MRFTRWVFRLAGLYGLLVLTPLYFMEAQVGRDFPPPIAHPEYFYGFIGVALAWQIAFLVIASDPVRFRPMMCPSVVEKFSYAIAVFWLYAHGRIAPMMLAAGGTDLVLGILFAAAWWRTGRADS